MLQTILKEHEHSDIIIAGDFNFPDIDWSDPLCRKVRTSTIDERIQANKLLSITDDYFLNQLITEPTRGKNTLDLVFTNITNSLYDCNITKLPLLSDHNVIELKMNSVSNKASPPVQNNAENTDTQSYNQYNFYKADYDEINKELSDTDWTEELANKSVEDQLTKFNEIVLNISAKHTSEKQANNRVYRSKYYKDRRALWRKRRRVLNKRPTESREKILRDIDENIKKSHKDEKLHNEHQAIDKISTNSKYFFSYANKTRKTREKVGPFINKDTKEIISDALEMAEALQTQFCSVFSTPDENKVIENIEEFFNSDPSEQLTLKDITFAEEDIEKAIKQIKPHAAAGPDGFPTLLLRECSKQLAKPLYIIFRNSLDSGKVPNVLKDAVITPIHKGGLKSDPKNYRPINLISQLLKTFEKVLCVKIVTYLEENNKMNDNQHGFRKLRSCLSQLIEHYDNVIEAVCSGSNIDIIYLDYSKAFDVVDHHILLRKIKQCGISGKIGVWISNFITNRYQKVAVNHKLSRNEPVHSGVPQGSVLGPILFLIMIADIDTDIIKSTVSSFADDTKVSHIINSRQDCADLQQTLDTIYQWSENNNMKFNELKFQTLRYGDNPETQNTEYKTPTGSVIQSEDKLKDLGIIMSRNLLYKDHIESLGARCRSLSGWILRTFETREKAPMLKLYNSLLIPRIDYCSQLWAPHENQDWNVLEAIQRRFTHKISEVSDLDYWSRLQALRLYSLQRRAERYQIIYSWKIMEGLAPNLRKNELQTRRSDRRGRYCVVPKLIQSNKCSAKAKTIRENSFSVQGPKLFNALPREIRDISNVSVDTFKSHLDKLLSRIPDQPGIPGYAGQRAAATNSIIDQIPNLGGGTYGFRPR